MIQGPYTHSAFPTPPLGSLAKHIKRGIAPKYIDDGGSLVLSQAVNQPDGLDWSRARRHDRNGSVREDQSILRPDDLVVNSTGKGTLGRVGYLGKSFDSIADGHVTIIRTNTEVLLPRFLFWALSTKTMYSWLNEILAVGATNQVELNPDRLATLPVPLPPLDEQRRIADFLDEQTARLGAFITLRRRAIDALVEREASLIDTVLEQPDHSRIRLARVARIQTGVTVDGGRRAEDGVEFPYLRVANVQADGVLLDEVKTISLSPDVADRYRLRVGDVLMTEGGDLDKLGRGTLWEGQVADCLHQNHVFAVRPTDALLPGYLALLTRTSSARSYFEMTGVKTTNLASTNSSKILDWRIPVPQVSMQRKLTKSLSEELTQNTKAGEAMRRQILLTEERRQALITAAVTGQLDVTAASDFTSSFSK